MAEQQKDNGPILVQQYRGVVTMIQQNYARRTATNRFYISIGSGLLVFLSYAVNPSVEREIQDLSVTMVALLGLALCLAWGLQIRTLRGLIDLQIGLAREMEKELPFEFFGRQQEALGQPSWWLQHGAIEQGLPFLVALPYLVILGIIYL